MCDEARVHFLNVGNGDCNIIKHQSGRVSVIDVCNAKKSISDEVSTEALSESSSTQKGMQGGFNQKAHPTNPIEYMRGKNINEIFRYIQTHPDMDHMNGIKDLFNSFTVINFWDIENNKKMDGKLDDRKFYQKIRKSTGNPKILHLLQGARGQYWDEDGIQILAPTQELVDEANESEDYNELSYVLLFKPFGKKILFCGDSGEKEWETILATCENDVSNIDVLIAPHHGRGSGGNDDYLDTLKPKLALLGNALSKDLDYSAYKNIDHFTNNQAGNIVLRCTKSGIEVYCANKSFADKYKDEDCAETEHGYLLRSI